MDSFLGDIIDKMNASNALKKPKEMLYLIKTGKVELNR